jgi:hypothetical protein
MARTFKYTEEVSIGGIRQRPWRRRVSFAFDILREEIDDLGAMLLRHFPGSVIFPSELLDDENEKHLERMRGVGKSPQPRFFRSLLEASAAGEECITYFRFPWPEDLASGDDRQLAFDQHAGRLITHQDYRRFGRCLKFTWPVESHPATELTMGSPDDPDESVHWFSYIDHYVSIGTVYDNEDPETVSFVDEIEQLIVNMTSCDYATYDIWTHEVDNADCRDETARRTIGILRYASLHDRTYLAFEQGPDSMSKLRGVRPEDRDAILKEAGLLEQPGSATPNGSG